MSAPIPTERQVQRGILAMRKVCFPRVFMFHVPNGAHLAGNNTARFKQMGALKGDGTKAGFPDLLCLWAPGTGCLMEVKRPKTGTLNDNQKSVISRLEEIRWPVAVVTSVDEAFAFLRLQGAPWSGATI